MLCDDDRREEPGGQFAKHLVRRMDAAVEAPIAMSLSSLVDTGRVGSGSSPDGRAVGERSTGSYGIGL